VKLNRSCPRKDVYKNHRLPRHEDIKKKKYENSLKSKGEDKKMLVELVNS